MFKNKFDMYFVNFVDQFHDLPFSGSQNYHLIIMDNQFRMFYFCFNMITIRSFREDTHVDVGKARLFWLTDVLWKNHLIQSVGLAMINEISDTAILSALLERAIVVF